MSPYYFASSSRLHICPSAVRAQARRDLRPMTSALSSHLEPLSQPVTAARLSPPPSLQQEKTGFDGSNPSRCGEHSPAPCQVPAVITPNRRATLEGACQMEIPNPGRGLLRSFKKTTDAPLSPFPRFPEELFSFFSEKILPPLTLPRGETIARQTHSSKVSLIGELSPRALFLQLVYTRNCFVRPGAKGFLFFSSQPWRPGMM